MTMRRGVEAPNFTAVPNRLFEIFPLMKEAELRVTLSIARETFGWRRDRKRLSLGLLMKLTGLSRQGVLNGTEFGLQRGTLERFEVKDYRNRKTFEYELIVLADDAACEGADRSTSLTGQLGGPVNLVDHNPALPVNEVDPLKEKTLKKKRGVRDVTGKAQQQGQLSAQVNEPSNPEHSSSNEAALETQTHEGGQPAGVFGMALASVAVVPQATVLASPDGVAADAAGQSTLPDSQDLDEPQVAVTEQATSLENVPAAAGPVEGAAADGSGIAKSGPTTPSVDSVRPVEPSALAARPVGPVDGPAYKALKSLLGNGLTAMLKESTRTGGLSRELWLKLDEPEIALVRNLAQAEVKTLGGNMITLTVRGLDRLIGAVKAEAKPGKASAPAAPIVGPQDLSHLDPQLVAGQRCTAFGDLGIVETVTNLGYIVLRDNGERVTVDRHMAKHLAKLKPSSAPLPEAQATEPVPFAAVGSAWRAKDGSTVTVTAAEGMHRTLSTGLTLPVFKLTASFEAVTA